MELANNIVDGPTFGNMMTKTMLAQEWSMSIEQVIEAEAQAQAICMQTGDFKELMKLLLLKKNRNFKEINRKFNVRTKRPYRYVLLAIIYQKNLFNQIFY